jgi:hypothetical protein
MISSVACRSTHYGIDWQISACRLESDSVVADVAGQGPAVVTSTGLAYRQDGDAVLHGSQ